MKALSRSSHRKGCAQHVLQVAGYISGSSLTLHGAGMLWRFTLKEEIAEIIREELTQRRGGAKGAKKKKD